MANDILTSIRGKRLGLDDKGRLLADPVGRGTQPVQTVIYNATAASTALSNFTAQRAFDNYATIPANTLQVGSLIRIKYQMIQTAVNGTDTIQAILTIGGALGASNAVTGGTALLTQTATAGGANFVSHGEYELAIRTIGSSGTMVGVGIFKKVPAAEATYSAVDDILASTTIDTTVDQLVTLGIVYGAASASNSARCDFMRVIVG
jgi:hypothetical protein